MKIGEQAKQYKWNEKELQKLIDSWNERNIQITKKEVKK